MSYPTTAARLAFFGMQDAPAANTTRARIDAVASGHAATVSGRDSGDRGPARFHQLHGAIPIGHGAELRITTQDAFDGQPPRLVIRTWRQKRDATWWPEIHLPGVWIQAGDVQAFAKAVAEAAQHLAGEAKP